MGESGHGLWGRSIARANEQSHPATYMPDAENSSIVKQGGSTTAFKLVPQLDGELLLDELSRRKIRAQTRHRPGYRQDGVVREQATGRASTNQPLLAREGDRGRDGGYPPHGRPRFGAVSHKGALSRPAGPRA
ncbi:hypothetical protein D9M68_101660 [compost metagenome]